MAGYTGLGGLGGIGIERQIRRVNRRFDAASKYLGASGKPFDGMYGDQPPAASGRLGSIERYIDHNNSVHNSMGRPSGYMRSVQDTTDSGLDASIRRIQRRNSGETFGNNLLQAQRMGIPAPGSMQSPTGATYGGITPMTYDQELGMARQEQQDRLAGAPKYNNGNQFASSTGGGRTVTVGQDAMGRTSLTGSGYTPEDRERFASQQARVNQGINNREQRFHDSRVLYNQQKYGIPDYMPAVADARQRFGLPPSGGVPGRGGYGGPQNQQEMSGHMLNVNRIRNENAEVHKAIQEHKMKGNHYMLWDNGSWQRELERLNGLLQTEPQFNPVQAGVNPQFPGIPTQNQNGFTPIAPTRPAPMPGFTPEQSAMVRDASSQIKMQHKISSLPSNRSNRPRGLVRPAGSPGMEFRRRINSFQNDPTRPTVADLDIMDANKKEGERFLREQSENRGKK